MSSQILFERYLAATIPDEDPETILETLLIDYAPPILSRVVRNRLGFLYTPADAAELSGEAMLELLRRLRSLRERHEPTELPFDGLVGGVAANTVHRFFARRYPERNRLRKRLRYIVESSDRFQLWRGPEGTNICGLAGNHRITEEPPAQTSEIERCLESMRKRPVQTHPLAALVYEILRGLGRPIDLSRLTAMAAELLGIREPSFSSSEHADGETRVFPTDPAMSAPLRIELRQRLESLWREVLLLPPQHRTALLLNARASTGAAVCLIVDLGVATFREVATSLAMTVDELAELWNRLPVDDNEIGARLGLQRQQVINLRCTARTRLARRESDSIFPGKGNK